MHALFRQQALLPDINVYVSDYGSAGTSPLSSTYFMAFSSSSAVSSPTTPEPGSIVLLISSSLTGAAFLRRKRFCHVPAVQGLRGRT
jgi:hypothetical protein